MRSAVKDLKEMVNKSRGNGKNPYSEEVDEIVDLDESGLDTTQQSSKNFNSQSKVGKSTTLRNPRQSVSNSKFK